MRLAKRNRAHGGKQPARVHPAAGGVYKTAREVRLQLRKLLSRAAIFLTLIAEATLASFKCPTAWVDIGDTVEQVLHKCGEPDQYETRIGNLVATFVPGVGDVQMDSILVEEYLYDFGELRYMRFLHFEDGKLMYIKELGYGGKNAQ